jgi:hypothetical protein
MTPPSISAVLTWLATSGGITGFLYWFLKKKLEDHFNRELEMTRHRLQLESQRLSVVYEHQKTSFRNLLIAMNACIKAVDVQEDENLRVPTETVAALEKTTAEEQLFLDEASDNSLWLFQQILNEISTDPGPSRSDTSRTLHHHAFCQMKFISERLAEHFRIRVGLLPTRPNPLFDVEILGACLLINKFNLGSRFRTEDNGPLRLGDRQMPEALVAEGKKNIELLKSRLLLLQSVLSDKPFRDWHAIYLSSAGRYIGKLNDVHGSGSIAS